MERAETKAKSERQGVQNTPTGKPFAQPGRAEQQRLRDHITFLSLKIIHVLWTIRLSLNCMFSRPGLARTMATEMRPGFCVLRVRACADRVLRPEIVAIYLIREAGYCLLAREMMLQTKGSAASGCISYVPSART